ncbi:MAG: NAD+ synthase, partial [Myxococcales bacterium]|nr:NAD+ synthase [Myxococcales bacterium]
MKLGLIQMNPTVGAVEANVTELLEQARRAADQGASLALASELVVPGYPPRDLLDRPAFRRAVAQATRRLIAEAPKQLTLIFGTLGAGDELRGLEESDSQGLLGNDAVVCRGGEEILRTRKCLLPTYDVFDEARYFAPGDRIRVLEHAGKRFAITVCEDAWAESEFPMRRYRQNPLLGLDASSADYILNLSASPFTVPKVAERVAVFSSLAKTHGLPVIIANQGGGNDELIFDGRSAIYNASGQVSHRVPAFESCLEVIDLEACLAGEVEHETSSVEELAYGGLVIGVRDYARKCGFKRAVLGLSGGIDSALTAVIAADALGSKNVIGVAMPTRYSSEGSVSDARQLAQNLGIEFHLVDIDPIFASYIDQLQPELDGLAAPSPKDVTLENIQARIRGATVMAFSNRSGALVLTTGNKSEVAVGYCTLYGDMVGGLAVINDVPKTLVYRLSRYVNRSSERIPLASITKPPSAELRPNQLDQDSLPEYDVLDRILELSVEQGKSREQILAQGLDADSVDRVLWLLRTNEYKR